MSSAPAAGTDELADTRFAVVDVETSGLRPRRHRVLQVAVVTADAQGHVVSEWSTYVRPRWWRVARLGPRDVHGITRAMLRGAPRESEVIAELAARLRGSVPTAHNAGFDLAFLRRAARRAGVVWPSDRPLCTLRMSRALDPDRQQSHRLADLCVRYGVEPGRAHDALADAEATAAVLPHLLTALHVETPDDLAPYAPWAAAQP
jgi:DNA polymerase-3 subunit epsilon